jgi:formylglycine-generating enzyme required for sulfatase activity
VYKANSEGRTAPVGSKGTNAFGLHDTAGNVWEWTEDCGNNSYYNAPTDGSANTSGNCPTRVFRGGAWLSIPRDLRSADRARLDPGYRGINLGFRVARTLSR